MSPTSTPALVASALGALVVAGAPSARALSCAPPGFHAPELGAVNVPTNTRVWCSVEAGDEDARVRLYDAAGAALSGVQTRLSALEFDLIVFTPDGELAPSTAHRAECLSGWPRNLEFSTGLGPQTERPPVPLVSAWEARVEAGDGWGPSYRVQFPQPSPSSALIVVDVGGTAGLDARSVHGAVADVLSLERAAGVVVGYGPCGGNWAEAALGATTSVALAAFDVTGAFSGWSDTITFTLPSAFPEPAPDLLVRVPEAGAEMTPASAETERGARARASRVPLASRRSAAPNAAARCTFAGAPAGPSALPGWLLAAAALVLTRRAARSSSAPG